MARNPLHAQIHIARKQLGLEDDDYRALLAQVTGATSSKDLTDDQRREVIAALKRKGFASTGSGERFRKGSGKSHVRLIWALWGELKRRGIWREAPRSSLIAFVEARTGVGDPEWLDYDAAQPVIEALKAMKRRGARGS